MYRWEITRAALAQRVFAIVRKPSYDQAAAEADDGLLAVGLTTLEVSLTTPFALQVLTTLVREVANNVIIGVGTVLDGTSARPAIETGARFLVAPSLDQDAIRTGHRYGVPVFPGVSTPPRASAPWELGADALKFFPASAYGPGWIQDVRAALPQAVPPGRAADGNPSPAAHR